MISSYNIVNDISQIVSGLGVTSSEALAQMENYKSAERAALERYNSLITQSEDVKHKIDIQLEENSSYINYAKRQREEAAQHISNAERYETEASRIRANKANLQNALQNEVIKMSSDFRVYVSSGQQNSSYAENLVSKIQAKSQELQKLNEKINAEAAAFESKAASERQAAEIQIKNAERSEALAATKLQAYEQNYNALIANAESEAAAVEQAKAAYLSASQDYEAALIAEQKAAEAERVNIENQRQDVEQKLQEQSAEINALDKESEELQEKLKKLQDDLKREKEKKQQSDSEDTASEDTEKTEKIKKYVRYGLVSVLLLLLFSHDDKDKKKKKV